MKSPMKPSSPIVAPHSPRQAYETQNRHSRRISLQFLRRGNSSEKAGLAGKATPDPQTTTGATIDPRTSSRAESHRQSGVFDSVPENGHVNGVNTNGFDDTSRQGSTAARSADQETVWPHGSTPQKTSRPGTRQSERSDGGGKVDESSSLMSKVGSVKKRLSMLSFREKGSPGGSTGMGFGRKPSKNSMRGAAGGGVGEIGGIAEE